MDSSFVRNQVTLAIDRARRRGQERRARVTSTESAYDTFLQEVAIPVVRMIAMSLKAERYAFTVSTPGGSVRLASDRTRDDFIELTLDASTDPPEVIARISITRGSRTLTDERPIKPGASPDTITDEDVLGFLLSALEPWLER